MLFSLRRLTLSLALVSTTLSSTSLYGREAPSDQQARAFADRLLSRMTLEEKIEQMEQAAAQYTTPEKANELAKKGVGSFLFVTDPVRINELQKIATTQSRLHIPLLFGYDVIHGFRTIYPVPLAMASSWDTDAVEHAQSMAALEARSAGVDWAFTPMVDIARDPRWGRIMEGAGEDPYLGEQMAAAQVRGLQGEYVGSPDHLLACVKHFAGYGATVGGRDYDSSDISDDLLYNVYLRPYHAAVKAGAATVMSAYMDLNSVPATGNVWLMRDILRKDWGFKGFVVSDWEAVKNLQVHGFAADPEDATVRALRAGINMEMTSSNYRDNLPAAVKSGKVTVGMIDDMVRPILEMKYRLGLFTNPYVDVARAKQITLSPEEREAARQTAEKTAVLLRNEGNVLPLKKNIRSLAVIGPLADSQVDTLGSWSIHANRQDTITIAQGLREKLPDSEILVTKGVEIERPEPASIFDKQVPPTRVTMSTEAERTAEFHHALDLAKKADTTVLVLGELQDMNGERASRADLTLPGKQEDLLEAVVALGKPVVLILMTGRPLNITWAASHVPAILDVWYPGTEGGHAVANLLTGDANPSGHLPLTWPRQVGQIPIFYNTNLTHIPNDIAHRYWDASSLPLFPFGYGLSYSTFTLSDLKVDRSKVQTNSTLKVSVKVQNTSPVAGEDVVQLYTHQRAGSSSRPVRELKAFHKIALAPGQGVTMQLTVSAEDLAFWSASLHKRVLEPGKFDIWVGDDSTATLHGIFDLVSSTSQ
jgi:beta-glucosidase